jgi:hypothetical protein
MSQVAGDRAQCLLGVKTGKSQSEQMLSGLPPKDGVIGLPACR